MYVPPSDSVLLDFLKDCGLAAPVIQPISGDASFRTYYRVFANSIDNLILMHSPPEHYDIKPFIHVAGLLQQSNCKTPIIYAVDEHRGLALLEYFPGTHIRNIISEENEQQIYCTLLCWLSEIQTNFSQIEVLPLYSDAVLLKELDVFLDWYVPEAPIAMREEFLTLWQNALLSLPPLSKTFCHLDFHVENIMLLEQNYKVGNLPLGLIDFQDAKIGSPIYDVVSLLEDARRFVKIDLAEELLDYYSSLRKFDPRAVKLHYHILGAQRNTRILGVFARKAKRDKNESYLQYMPYLYQYLEHDLSIPELSELRPLYKKLVG